MGNDFLEIMRKAYEEGEKRRLAQLAARTPEQIARDEEIRAIGIETHRKRTNTPTPPPAKKEVVFVTEDQHQVGDILKDAHGREYRVTKLSYWLSDRDVADMEDQDIFGVQAGWQTEARLV